MKVEINNKKKLFSVLYDTVVGFRPTEYRVFFN